VSGPLASRGIRAVVLDIEGTTTPIAFVHEVLFSYARDHLGAFLRAPANAAIVDTAIAQLAGEHRADLSRGERPPPWNDVSRDAQVLAVEAYAGWLMDRDRKSPGLKALQGHIWQHGYEAGALTGVVYDDVPVALRRWHAGGLTIAIYSSGSARAQRQLFRSTPAGDLTPLISHFFDTAVGPKRSPDSYGRIAGILGVDPGAILFVSDVVEELAAARAAGFAVVLSVRPGHRVDIGAGSSESVTTFDELP
jgi:2,3-diketo-5-methylthio-1-phosphopentane phosphatase